eukprot:SAG11_NODE_1621_length_4562_cov_2.009187_4_plen_57_part_00
MDKVKRRFEDTPQKYKDFLKILQRYAKLSSQQSAAAAELAGGAGADNSYLQVCQIQ